MSILIGDVKTQPALTFDKLHVDLLVLRQDRVNGIPGRRIESVATRYAVDTNGNKVYDSGTYQVNVPDFAAVAVGEYLAANPGASVADAEAAYIAAVTAVATEMATSGVNTFKLMAYFEAAVGRIYELSGGTGSSTMG